MSGRLRARGKPREKVEIPIAPMIDCVFLLLIYFLMTTDLQPQEADIGFRLPGLVTQDVPLEVPEELVLEIDSEGQVWVNGYPYDEPGASRMAELRGLLYEYRVTSEASQLDFSVSIAPEGTVPHQVVVRVIDAVTSAGISTVHFALGED